MIQTYPLRGLLLLAVGMALGGAPGVAAQDTTGTARGASSRALPLSGFAENRQVPIDQTEGSWISLDVSPDGNTIVFDFLGDLFTVPIGGGDATQLTHGMGFDAQPRYSPDGEWIAFQSDSDGGENLYAMRVDGSDTTQLTTGAANRIESPEWTPDGEYLIVSKGGFRTGLPKLWMVHREGGRGAQLVDEPQNLKTIGAAFGPDGRYIWYAARTGDWQYNAQFPQYQLTVYDRDTGETYTRSSRYGSGIRPTLSPDGKWLVYGTRHEEHTGLVLRDLATGAERWLAYPVQHDDQESRGSRDVLPGMSFTPDSRHLVASYGGRIWKIPVEGGAAEEIPFRVRFDLEVTPAGEYDYPIQDDPGFTVRQIRDAVPSPDGSTIAFTALDKLWLADADGSDVRRLMSVDGRSEHFPAWSPDGAWIAFTTWEGDEGHVYRIRPQGGNAQRLSTVGANYARPAWSPGGDRIVVLKGYARGFRDDAGGSLSTDELVWIPAAGGAATTITPMARRARPHFTEDPDRIYFHDGNDGLASIRWDGSDRKHHVKVTGRTAPGANQPENANEILMAPRGDRALAIIGANLYVVTVPRTGGDTPTISVADPDNAQFPAMKISGDLGGEFATWGSDARRIHFSLANAHFTYDLDAAAAYRDSVASLTEEAREEDEGYRPAEVRIVIQAERDIPRGTVVLRGARVVTMAGDQVIENADLVVRDNRIAAVGTRGTVDVPADATVIDVSGRTILPGFVDAHAHLRPAREIHKSQPWAYLANLAFGVTTARDPQTGTTDVLSYSDMVTAGEILGPRIYSTGPGLFWEENLRSLDHTRTLLRRYSDYFDTNTIKMYVTGNRRQRQWIIQAARELRLMPTTEGSLNLKQNLTETIDGYPGLEHALPVYPLYSDIIRLFVETGRVYTPTLLVAYGGPWAENWFFETEEVHDDARLRRFTPHSDIDAKTLRRPQWFREEQYVSIDHGRFVRDLVEAGGRVGIGSHGQLQGLGYHWELWSVASGGLSNHDALRAATIFGAQAIGLDEDLGSIEVGKLADLVVIGGDPLRDLRATRAVEHVMKNGRLYEAETLREIWPRQRDLPVQWWWGGEPERDLPGLTPGSFRD